MKINVNGYLIDTENILYITEPEMGNDNIDDSGETYYTYNELLKFSPHFIIKLINKEVIIIADNITENLVKFWSDNQSTIPNFML
jgi:hypothetical protein